MAHLYMQHNIEKILLLLLLALSFNVWANDSKNNAIVANFDTVLFEQNNFHEHGYTLYKTDREKSKQFFETGIKYFTNKGDTTNINLCLMGLSDIENRQGHYNRAFEILQEINKRGIRKDDYITQINIHRKLGTLYGIYEIDSLSLFHLKRSLEINKNHPNSGQIISAYFAVAEQIGSMGNYNMAIEYLDSCYISRKHKNRLIYVDAYLGYCYLKKQEYTKAETYLSGLIEIFETQKLAFLAKVYEFQGELNMAQQKNNQARYYFEQSLEVIDSMQVHNEIKPLILERLASLYHTKGDYKKAYNYMVAYKNVTDDLFHTQSIQNKELFEIKSEYSEDLMQKEVQIAEQNERLELERKSRLRLLLLIGIMVLLTVFGLVVLRQRFQVKQMILQKEKREAVLETRNKELTANALQIIEKEQAVQELLQVIKEQTPQNHKQLSSKYKSGNRKVWNDFHLRFTQTNAKFYDSLLKLHPTLTQTDLKHCALIKLNFDSKEMSVVLGISLHSVHVARSRIRKKLQLKREDSLSRYLSTI